MGVGTEIQTEKQKKISEIGIREKYLGIKVPEKCEGTRPPHAEDVVFRSKGRESRSRKDTGLQSREDGHHRISMEK